MGFYCQKNSRSVIFRKQKPPRGGLAKQKVLPYAPFCLVFMFFFIIQCGLYANKKAIQSQAIPDKDRFRNPRWVKTTKNSWKPPQKQAKSPRIFLIFLGL
jgi:hypothetical protein